MYLWTPMIAWSVGTLFRTLIVWRGRIGYERARAASVIDIVRAIPRGEFAVLDNRADGTVLRIEPWTGQGRCSPALLRVAGRDLAER